MNAAHRLGPLGLPLGTRVRINGLVSRPEFNSKLAHVLSFDGIKAR